MNPVVRTRALLERDALARELGLVAPADYGKRPDGSKKGRGYFGEIKRPDGAVSTELSVSVEFDGKEQEIPLLVPTLSRSEIDRLIGGERPDDGMVRKAVQHARGRIAAGKNPFAEDGDSLIPLPNTR